VLLLDKTIDLKLVKAAQEAGSVPVSWLPFTATLSSCVMLLQDSGSVPLMLDPDKDKPWRCNMPFQASGRGPLRFSAEYAAKSLRCDGAPRGRQISSQSGGTIAEAIIREKD